MHTKYFKWNDMRAGHRYWDLDTNREEWTVSTTDKYLIDHPEQAKFEDVLAALCRVVSELVEIEEQRNENE